MNSTMAMWDLVEPMWGGEGAPQIGVCARCGRSIPLPRQGWVAKRYCSERCRKRDEKARWKKRWKERGVNKYIGGRAAK